MGWAGLSLVSDAEIGQLEPEAVASGSPWGAVTWSSARTEAKRDLKIWLEMDFPDIVGVADRVVDTWAPDWVFGYTGSAYTDLTDTARNDTEADVSLSGVFATFGTDKLYIGAAWEFDALKVLMTGTRNANASTMTVKYSGPAGWTSISPTDGTAVSTATFGKTGRITWTTPTDWQRITLNGTSDEYYWIEISVSAALTSGTSAAQLLPVRAPDGLKRTAAYLALSHIYNGLAAAAAVPDSWRAQGEKYYARARETYGMLKANRALWLDVNRDEAVTQSETVVRPVFLGRA